MLMTVDVDARPGAPPSISAPRPLFQTGLSVTLNLDQFGVSRDGRRFLIRRPESCDGTKSRSSSTGRILSGQSDGVRRARRCRLDQEE